MPHNFENLDVWRRSVDLAVKIYGLTKGWRDYSLRDQMLRSSVSIPSNIAEGSERESEREFKRFLAIAKGSAAEMRTQVVIAGRIGLLTNDVTFEIRSELIEISRMLHALILGDKKRRPKTSI
jgi:four helix bundle protein